MNIDFLPSEELFRDEVRDFLSAHLTDSLRHYTNRMTSVYANKEVALEWQEILAKQGWAAPAWPTEYGGCDWTIAQHYIFDVENARAGAPPLSPMGIGMCGPALLGHGSSEQKLHFLPRILNGKDFWCQGYSEPGAGSDLASLSMSAEEGGDCLICNGSKIWVTHAHEANMCFCLVRTDNSGKPQQGITFLLIDMLSEGITVKPIYMLSGEHIQNEIFFENVKVPKQNIVGKINDGWTVAKYLLEFERGGSSYGPKLLERIRRIRMNAMELEVLDEGFTAKLALAEIQAQSLQASELQFMASLSVGGTPGLKASMMKINGTELSQHVTELAIELAGYYASPYQPHHTSNGGPVLNIIGADNPIVGEKGLVAASAKYLNDRAGSIYAGSNEIQRNILAKGHLKL